MTASPTPIKQLVYFPYLSLGEIDEIRFGRVTIWNADRQLDSRIADPAVRARVTELLAMNKQTASVRKGSNLIRGIGIAAIGEPEMHELTADESAEVEQARMALFLAGLDHNVSIKTNANVGHVLYTSENFSVVYQNFALDREYIGERAGVIIQFNLMGLKISETAFPKPSYVNLPYRPGLDRSIIRELDWLRGADPTLFRRVMRAATEFSGSYYNTPSVDVNSRIFAQVMAFEILLDIPETSQRKHFKDRLQALCDDQDEPQITYASERSPGKFDDETRSVKGMWADQIYTLRNHLIHGQDVPGEEFVFRDRQHHVLAAAILFVGALKRTINMAREAVGEKPRFYDAIDWTTWVDENDYPPKSHEGFAVRTNPFAELAAGRGMTPDEYLQELLATDHGMTREDGLE